MVTTEIKNLSNCKKELKITMAKDDLEPIREQETLRVRKDVQVPGFRKGKAPVGLIKRNYAQAIEAYTLEAAVDVGLREAIEQNNLQVVGQPEATNVELDDDGNVLSTIEVETFPEIELKKYKGLELTRDKYVITDALVDKAIEEMRRERAEVTVVEGPVEEGHIVQIDLQELDSSGVPIVGKKYENMSVRVGEGRFDADLEKQFIGLKSSEVKKIEKIYPDDFPQKDWAGKKELYEVTIKEIKQENLAELNEEFIKDLGLDYKTVEEFKAGTRENLEKRYQQESENRLAGDISQALLQENPFDIPRALIDNYLDHIVDDMRRRDAKLKEDDIRRQYEPEAEFTIKWHYLKEKLAAQENLQVNDDDVQTFLEELQDEKMREFYKASPSLLDNAKENILNKKIIDFIVENAKVTDNEITPE